jgi:hypothetical protein
MSCDRVSRTATRGRSKVPGRAVTVLRINSQRGSRRPVKCLHTQGDLLKRHHLAALDGHEMVLRAISFAILESMARRP